MAKTPKSVTVIIGLVIAGIQAIAELIKATKTEEKRDDKETTD